MRPAIRAILESKGVAEKPTERLSIRAVLKGWRDPAAQPVSRGPVHHAVSPAELAIVDGRQTCSVCRKSYFPAPASDPADHRCGECKARARQGTVQAAYALGDRAEVRIDCRWSSCDGWTGIGRRVVLPEHGWMVRLDRESEQELFFGLGAVRVERRLQPLPEPRKALLVRKGGNGR